MNAQPTSATNPCPDTVESVTAEARQGFEALLSFCLEHDGTFWECEKGLLSRVFALGGLLVRLALASRHRRLNLEPYLACEGYRLGAPYAERNLKTAFGMITYGRAHLIRTGGGCGFHPLDAVLGLTRDGFSPWMVQFVTRLATRMSYEASRLICRSALGWSPSAEAIEHLVLGLGRQAAPFMEQQAAPRNEGEVLVIEMDGKCPRRRPRRSWRSGVENAGMRGVAPAVASVIAGRRNGVRGARSGVGRRGTRVRTARK